MATDERFDELISRWLEETAPQRLPERVLTATFERTRRKRQQVGWRALLGRLQMPRLMPALGGAAVVVVVAVLAVSAFVSQQRLGGPDADSRGLGIFAPVAGRIVYCTNSGLWAVDPSAQSPPRRRCASRERPTPTANVHRSPSCSAGRATARNCYSCVKI